ncbi:glycerate kinase [Listeria monocytogenes]|nr:glycerate kinase [Listeria monocytogenes]
MKIVIAPDSFKESATAVEVANAIKKGWTKARPADQISLAPVSDGGEGFLTVLSESSEVELFQAEVTNLNGHKITASYGILASQETAIIESANTIGLDLIPAVDRNPAYASSKGVGELILAALNHNVKKIIIGLGGSGTNDGGAGLIQALGVALLDKNKQPIPPGGIHLQELAYIDASNLNPKLKNIQFQIACDVTNPLLGENGATFVFGAQKGATPEMLVQLERAMQNYGAKLDQFSSQKITTKKGAGAAGGIAAGLMTFLNADVLSGSALVMELSNMKDKMKDADIVIVGEGRMDKQSMMGKIPVQSAQEAKKQGCFVLAIVGSLALENNIAQQHGIDAFFPNIPEITDLPTLFENTTKNLERTAENIAKLTLIGK